MICQYQCLRQQRPQIRKEQQGQFFDFEFPPQIFKNKQFRNANQINKELIRVGIKCFFRRGRLFIREDYKCQAGINSVFKCKHRQCSAKLIFSKRTKSKFIQTIIFKNIHYHKKSRDPQKAKRQQINQFILNLSGKQFQDFQVMRQWMEKFDLSSREALYIVDQLYWNNNTEDQMLTRLSYQGHCIRRAVQSGQMMIIYLRTRTMKYNYLKYGQTINIQVNYDILRKPTKYGNRYAVVYFYGQDQNLRLILFSVAVMTRQNKQNFKRLFQFFFDTTCQGHQPISIISDQIKTLTAALAQLKKQRNLSYNHLYSWIYVIENWKPLLKQYKNGQLILSYICNAMQQLHEKTFLILLNQIKNLLKGEDDIIRQFFSKMDQCCCRMLPKKFIGYSISTIFGKRVMHRTKTTTNYRVHTSKLFNKLIQIEKILQREIDKVSVMNTGVIKHCPADINFFQNKIQYRLMDLLVKNYMQSKDLKKQRPNKLVFILTQKNGKSFICRFIIQFDHWECQCGQLYLMGIPCSHLVSVIIDQEIGASLSYYINSRWIHEKQQLIVEHAKPFITNKCRRP